VVFAVAQPTRCAAPKPESPSLSLTFTCSNGYGLHARPAALLVRAVSPFRCEVTARHHDHQVNARSILGLLTLAVGPAGQITFTVRGPDAAAALMAIAQVFEHRLDNRRGTAAGTAARRDVAQPTHQAIAISLRNSPP
jgi:phosphocarrier protein